MADTKHPLLIFPEPTQADPVGRSPFPPPNIKRPSHSDQAGRLEPQFRRLQNAIEGRRLALQDNPLGIQPEQVLVLETVGDIQGFVNAVRRIDGLEWLVEYELRNLVPEYGFEWSDKPKKPLDGRLFLVMTDQAALRELNGLFKKWEKNRKVKFPHGLTPLRDAFDYLKEIRPWSIADRLRETGVIEDWKNRLGQEQVTIPFELELWHRSARSQRDLAEDYLRSEIQSMGGVILQQTAIPDIAYHAILGQLPNNAIKRTIDLLDDDVADIGLLSIDDIMYVRPVGQCAIRIADSEEPTQVATMAMPEPPQGEPVAALLDGMPLTGHHLCIDRMRVDDPDGYSSAYQATDRCHGTAMTSLICHGDLDRKDFPLPSPLYVRPIMKPVRSPKGTGEQIPDNVLPVDLVHRAVRRLYEGEDDHPPVAPTVQIINISVCDPARPFFREMSGWARLLDWLSWKYQILFIVSAGNALDDIELDAPTESLANLQPKDAGSVVVSAITADTRNRRILAPAESVNALSVGAAHNDWSGEAQHRFIDPFPSFSDWPSVISRHGPGYRRALKPEILVSGGRQTVASKIPTRRNRVLTIVPSTRPPGQAVATPGTRGMLDEIHYTKGTSNAAALTTRQAVAVHEMLNDLRGVTGGHPDEEYEAVVVKALLVHAASWGSAAEVYKEVQKTRHGSHAVKEQAGRFLGYGAVDFDRIMSCTAQRVTVLGVGQLDDGDAHRFDFPVPPSLVDSAHHRRLTITLAWLTPVASTTQKYRMARLWFDFQKELASDRKASADHNAVRRGTVQHEIVEGDNVEHFAEGDNIKITVNCRADAGDLPRPVRYGLAVTLEVAEDVGISIYQEVRDRLHVRVRSPRR